MVTPGSWRRKIMVIIGREGSQCLLGLQWSLRLGSCCPHIFLAPAWTCLKKLDRRNWLQLRKSEYQQRTIPGVPAVRKKKKVKNDGNPEITTAGEYNSPENVPQDHAASAPTAHDTVLVASVPSSDTGISGIKVLEYEAISFYQLGSNNICE
jgi:hypothetical protein